MFFLFVAIHVVVLCCFVMFCLLGPRPIARMSVLDLATFCCWFMSDALALLLDGEKTSSRESSLNPTHDRNVKATRPYQPSILQNFA